MANRPNILVIVADDLGYGDLACYGADDMRTPHLDGLAAGGVRFTQFYANCPVCSPTRAAILTGKFPDHVGVPGVIRTHRDNSWGYLAGTATLLPERLRAAGYHNMAVGKWHLGLEEPCTPLDRGFDRFHGFLGDMMDDYYTHLRHDENYMRRDGEVIDPEGHATDLFTQWSMDYVNERAGADTPFFLYLAYNAPHVPIQPPQEWVEQVKKREPGAGEDRAKLIALIEHMDDGIGRVLQALEDTGQAENTLVLFVSDNGGQLNIGASNGSLRGDKGEMYEGGIRVPACVRWPGRIEPAQEGATPLMTTDIQPALCEAAGVDAGDGLHGASFLPEVTGAGPAIGERRMCWVRREGGGYGGLAYYAIRRGPYKLVQPGPFSPLELYNVEEDPGETTPLPQNHPRFQGLFGELRDHVNASGVVPWQRPE